MTPIAPNPDRVRRTGARRRVLLACAASTAAIAILAGAGASPPTPQAAAAPADAGAPNVIAIVTDDQDELVFSRGLMPNTFGLLEKGGTRLDNFTIVSPLCCPSRATHLTGQYGHNNGVMANTPGYPALDDRNNTLPSWLQNAGYRTAHVGRFLNGYRRAADRPAEPAAGWDRWVTLLDLHYRDYDLSLDGRRRSFRGSGSAAYVTRNLHRRTNRIVRELAAGPHPFYLQLDELAPHSDHLARGSCTRSALPGPQLLRPVRNIHLPANPAIERDVSDKPSYIAELPRLTDRARDAVQQRLRCRAAAIREVDLGVGRLIDTLRRLNEFNDTVILFYSDNGYFSGQHRLLKSKGLPYEESVQVPALIRVPPSVLGERAARHSNLPLANIDIAPTFLDLAGAQPCNEGGECRVLDGRSLMPALRDPGSWPDDRAIGIEIDQRGRLAGGTLACSYSGVRAGEQVYVHYTRLAKRGTRKCVEVDESEHYRLGSDPRQRRNLYPPRNERDREEQRTLATLSERIGRCAGNLEGFGAPDPGNACE